MQAYDQLTEFAAATYQATGQPWNGPRRAWTRFAAALLGAWYTHSAGVRSYFGAIPAGVLEQLRRVQ